MRGQDEIRVWMVAGAAGSLVLAIVLIPLRTLTAASILALEASRRQDASSSPV